MNLKPDNALIALVTAPDIDTARTLARAALEKRLAACANLLPSLESHYWWKGQLDSANEVLLILKTSSLHALDLERLIVSLHPYDTPEFVLIPVAGANERYLRWWGDALVSILPCNPPL